MIYAKDGKLLEDKIFSGIPYLIFVELIVVGDLSLSIFLYFCYNIFYNNKTFSGKVY